MGMMDEVKTKKKLKAAENWFRMAESARTPEKQIEYYTKSLDANPYNAEAWFRRGRVMEKIGRFNDAQRSFDHAVEIDPDYQGLIGKGKDTYEVTASGHRGDLQASTPDMDVFQQPEKDEWLTENEETEETGFIPPAGDESIFSGIGIGQEEEAIDDNTFVGMTSDDNVLQAPSGTEREVTFSAVSIAREDVEKQEEEEEEEEEEEVVVPISDERGKPESIITTYPETSGISGPHIKSTAPVTEKRKGVQMTETERSLAESTPYPATGTSDMDRTVDIRIPLAETIRFWVIGIVAMAIALKLAELI